MARFLERFWEPSAMKWRLGVILKKDGKGGLLKDR